MSDETSQLPLSASGASESNQSDQSGKVSAKGNGVTIVSPQKLEDRLTEALQPLLQLRPNQIPRLRESISMAVVETTAVHRGPIPAPQQFREYEAILPGAADRILAMAEKEQSHRHSWEHRHLTWDVVTNILGLVFGFSLSLALAAGAVYCAKIGQPWVAGTLVGFSAFGAVATLIKGRRLFGKADHQTSTQKPPAASQGQSKTSKNKKTKR